MNLHDRLGESAQYILNETNGLNGQLVIAGGTGQNHLLDQITVIHQLSFNDIPHVPSTTVESHTGSLVLAELNGFLFWIVQGRLHAYEGYSMDHICHLVRTLKWISCRQFIITNVTGGINPAFRQGQLILVSDHINLHARSPLTGHNDERIGPRFPDMSDTYNSELATQIQNAASNTPELGAPLARGVYASLPGPQLETPAEYNYLHRIGADLVGMSTVPEVIALKHMEAEIAVISMISNECHPDKEITPTTIQSVIEVAEENQPKLSALILNFIRAVAAE